MLIRSRLRTAFVFALLLVAAATLRAGENVWTPIGPDGGQVTAVAVHPHTPRIVYVGTDGGGVFKSTDGGRSWRAVNNGVFTLFIRDLVIDPLAPETLYLSAGDLPAVSGVHKTTNGGSSWINVSGGLPTPPLLCGCGGLLPITDLAIDPLTPRVLYAVAGGGVYKTERGGGWFNSGSGLNDGVLTVAVSPSSPNVLYAGTTGGAYKSTDAGATWSVATAGLGRRVLSLAIHPQDPRTVYAGTGAGVFKTTNGGANWVAMSNGLPGASQRVLALAIDPSAPATVYAGTARGVFKSVDNGQHWRSLTLSYPPVGVVSLAPSNPQVIYAGNGLTRGLGSGEGVYKSGDGGESWTYPRQGLRATEVNSLAPGGAPGVLWAGLGFPGVARTEEGGVTWRYGLQQLNVQALAADPANPDVAWAGTDTGVFKTFDRGVQWYQQTQGLVSPSSQGVAAIEALAVDPENPAIVFAAGGGGFFKSTDGGGTWELVLTLLRSSLTLAIAPSDPATVYAGGGARLSPSASSPSLFRSRDGGATWEPLHLLHTDIFALAVDPQDPDVVYAGVPGGLSRSTDGGDTWTFLSLGIDAGAQALAIDPSAPNVVYAGTAFGVVRSADGGTSWIQIHQGLANRNVLALLIDPLAPATVYAGTRGGGVYRLDRAPCEAGETTLCLQAGRFRAEVVWRNFQGQTGQGHAVPLTPDTGAFWFFGGNNLELMVKVIDGRAINQHYWVFFGALTNVEYTLTVTDTETGQVKTYFNPLNRFASTGDTSAFSNLEFSNPATATAAEAATAGPVALPAGACAAGDTAVCLQEGRFRVEVTWEDFAGNTGAGHAVPLTPDTGAFWFFGPDNLELMIKVVDGRALNGRFWVFYGALSNVGYTIKVTDTATGAARTYTNPPGKFASAGDTQAF